MAALKVLQITDLHILASADESLLGVNTEYYFRQTLQHAIDAQGPFDLILLTGDLAQAPCTASYQRIRQILDTQPSPFLCLPGNHDDPVLLANWLSGGQKVWRAHNWQIISLNSHKPGCPGGHLSTDELHFLENTLRADLSPALIAVHHHSLPCGSTWMDTMQIDNGLAFLDLASAFPQVKAITCGHLHQEMTMSFQGIALFATPATCFQFIPNSKEFGLDSLPPGYRVFELHDDGSFDTAVYRLPIQQLELDHQAHGY